MRIVESTAIMSQCFNRLILRLLDQIYVFGFSFAYDGPLSEFAISNTFHRFQFGMVHTVMRVFRSNVQFI